MAGERHPWGDGRDAWERMRHWIGDGGSKVRDGADALDILSDVASMRHLLDQVELAAVQAARRAGRSWSEIATRLGVTRQAAWERWRDLDEATEPSREAGISVRDTVRAVEAAAADLPARIAAQGRRRRSMVTVPNVVGLSFDDARMLLMGRGLVAVGPDPDGPPLTTTGWPDGVVVDQTPESGAKVPAGASVTLWLDRGGGSAGVREPRRPAPGPKSLQAMRDEPTAEAAG